MESFVYSLGYFLRVIFTESRLLVRVIFLADVFFAHKPPISNGANLVRSNSVHCLVHICGSCFVPLNSVKCRKFLITNYSGRVCSFEDISAVQLVFSLRSV